jgi:ABC-type microcin C transport system duplicated ATPase subunit YejF
VGFQIEEVLRLHLKMSAKAARKRAIELLKRLKSPARPAAWTPIRTNCRAA